VEWVVVSLVVWESPVTELPLSVSVSLPDPVVVVVTVSVWLTVCEELAEVVCATVWRV
jgi:hypothetical protein